MQAIVYRTYGSPDVLRCEEIDQPIPAGDEVLTGTWYHHLTFLTTRPEATVVSGQSLRLIPRELFERLDLVGQ